MRRQSGVTLIELLIAVAIGMLLMTLILGIWISSSRAARVTASMADAQSIARSAIAQLDREVRSGKASSARFHVYSNGVAADCSTVDCSLVPAGLDFQTILPDDTVLTRVTYFVNDDAALVRVADGESRIVATSVSQFDVAGTGDSALVVLVIEVDERTSELRSRIGFRNP